MYRRSLAALLVTLSLCLTLGATAQGREGEPPDRKGVTCKDVALAEKNACLANCVAGS